MALFKYKLDTVNNYYAFLNEVTGDDANDGLTPETAVASMNRLVTILNTYAGALRRVGVIYAHRIYDQAITVTRTSTKSITFDFVNRTVIDGSGASVIQFSVKGDIINNAQIINYISMPLISIIGVFNEPTLLFNNVYFNSCTYGILTCSTTASSNAYCIYNLCVIINSAPIRSSSTRINSIEANNCIFINLLSTLSGGLNPRIKNSIFQSCEGFKFSNTYDFGIALDYCNILGNILWNGDLTSNIGFQSIGLNLNGLSINPQFNDTTNGVYTVRSTSPMLYRGENGQHIGIGEAIYVSATELFSLGETIDNLTLQSGKLIRPDDSSDALLETYMMSLGATRSIERIALVAALAYATSGITRSVAIDTEGYIAYDSGATYHTGSSITDSSIKYKSIADNNTGNTPAASPLYWERMTWESGVSYPSGKIIQYTDNKWYRANAATSTTWVAGEWDLIVPVDTLSFGLKYGRTNSDAEAMDWEMFNFNQPLLVDSTGNGTANNDYDPDTGASIRINFWKVRIMIKTVR